MPAKLNRDSFFWTIALQTVVVNFFLGGFGPAQPLLRADQGIWSLDSCFLRSRNSYREFAFGSDIQHSCTYYFDAACRSGEVDE